MSTTPSSVPNAIVDTGTLAACAARGRLLHRPAGRAVAVGEQHDPGRRQPVGAVGRHRPDRVQAGEHRLAGRGRLGQLQPVDRRASPRRGPWSARPARWPTWRTRPAPGCTSAAAPATNSLAASCAASIRVGATSSACIDSDTSMASMTVARSSGCSRSTDGRAIASASAEQAEQERAGRDVPAPAEPARRQRAQQVDVGEPHRVRRAGAAAARRRRRRAASTGSDGQQPPRLQETDHRVVPRVRACRCAATNRTMSSSQSESVRSRRCWAPAAAQRVGDRGALRGGGLRRTGRAACGSAVCTSCSAPVSGSARTSTPTSGSSSSRGSTTSIASTSCRTPSLRSGRAQLGRRRQEVGDHHGQAAPARRAVEHVDQGAQVGPAGLDRGTRRSRAAGPAPPCGPGRAGSRRRCGRRRCRRPRRSGCRRARSGG